MYIVKYNLFLHGSLISLHPQSCLFLRFLLFQCFTSRFGLFFSEAFTPHAVVPTFMVSLLLALTSLIFFHLVVGRLYKFLGKLLISSVLQYILLGKHRLNTLFGRGEIVRIIEQLVHVVLIITFLSLTHFFGFLVNKSV